MNVYNFWSAEKLLSRVKISGNCLIFTGIASSSYGPHRLSFFLNYGYLPKVVMHKCDNRNCVKACHLIPGTHKDNMRDMAEKKRHWSHERNRCVSRALVKGYVMPSLRKWDVR